MKKCACECLKVLEKCLNIIVTFAGIAHIVKLEVKKITSLLTVKGSESVLSVP